MTLYVIYTAVLGGYDNLPTVSVHDERIRYLCFSDVQLEDSSVWEVVPISSYFVDRKITNGFLKANSHIIFGSDVISLWIDGNLRDLNVTVESLMEMVNTSPVATLPHLVRTSISEEVDEVVRVGLEHPSIAQHWRQLMAEARFPDNQRLAETMLVARDHRNPALRRANGAWWRLISSGIRRDQLSFNYALWESGVVQTYIDADWRAPNRLFSRVAHKNPIHRGLSNELKASLLNHGAVLDMPGLPNGYPNDVGYISETWTEDELAVLRQLNRNVHETTSDGKVEGGYCHFDKQSLRQFTPPDPRRSWKREYLRRAVRGCRNAVEVGFNAGHSAAIMLATDPFLRLTSVDICSHPYAIPCSRVLERHYAERFQFVPARSDEGLAKIDAERVDFVHIDGGHDPDAVNFDLDWFCEKAARGCRLLVDDIYVAHISGALADRVKAGILAKARSGLPSSGENQLFVKV